MFTSHYQNTRASVRTFAVVLSFHKMVCKDKLTQWKDISRKYFASLRVVYTVAMSLVNLTHYLLQSSWQADV